MPAPNYFSLIKMLKHNSLTTKQYHDLYELSIHDPLYFWETQAHQFIDWFTPWQETLAAKFGFSELCWFKQGKLNASFNCLDRHLPLKAKQTAIIWEGNNKHEKRKITYQELFNEVNAFANVLLHKGIKKGDRVAIYLPQIPEAVITMLACARVGAIHSVIFAGFSPEALRNRILDANCCMLITADECLRGDKIISLKKNADEALQLCPNVKNVIVVKRTGNKISFSSKDTWYHEEINAHKDTISPLHMDANDPLFILYTSGSTGKPKGVLHGIGGYLVYVATTFYYVFNYKEGDIFWCTADVGWITGHSYVVYGPLLHGATVLLYEGTPAYPSFSRYWEIIDQYQVNIFYTAPTAIRALKREGDAWVTRTNRSSLKLLGSVGEPLNPDAWQWYYNVVGEQRCPIVNTWWQTETGGIILTQFPQASPQNPGSVGWPFFGILPSIVDEQGLEITDSKSGQLLIKHPWPGIMQTIYQDHERYNNYFKVHAGYYYTGDSAFKKNGDYWITGRIDDVLNVAGHRIGSAEVEDALVAHPEVAEAAVVGYPHPIKGESIYAFVTLNIDSVPSEKLQKELIDFVRKRIGPFAAPEYIHWAPALPKTRSGKIMRRILRKIANNDLNDLGDISTLADPNVIKQII